MLTQDRRHSLYREDRTFLPSLTLLAADHTAEFMETDGTVWSHACTMGTRIKNTEFTIDEATLRNFVRVFTTGYPQKVPVDYDHGSEIADGSRPFPAAGQVLDMKAVIAEADLNDSMKRQVQKAARTLADTRNFGLWVRWRPTSRALNMVKEREYTEMSIAFGFDVKHNETGNGQGPAITSIALTNLPFLDDMLPVAASRGSGAATTPPGAPGTHAPERQTMTGPNLLMRLSAALGRAFSNDDEAGAEAERQLTALRTENQQLTVHRDAVNSLLSRTGKTTVAEALSVVDGWKTTADGAAASTATAKKKAIETQVATVLTRYESKLTPVTKEKFARMLTRDLESGQEIGKTDAEEALKIAAPGITEQGQTVAATGVDVPGADDEEALDRRANEIIQSDAALKKQSETDFNGAYKVALRRAGDERKYRSPQQRELAAKGSN